jgi:hypothetical protein
MVGFTSATAVTAFLALAVSNNSGVDAFAGLKKNGAATTASSSSSSSSLLRMVRCQVDLNGRIDVFPGGTIPPPKSRIHTM